MAINFVEYKWELCNASRLVRNAMKALKTTLLDDGFQIPGWLVNFQQPPQFWDYVSGKLFFGRVWNELDSALSIIDTLTEELASGKSDVSQRLFDEVSLRQRKLFETFGLIAMLSRQRVYDPVSPTEPAKPELYFLHFHLQREIQQLEHRSNDLIRYFGGVCDDTIRQIAGRQQLMVALINTHHIDGGLCNWRWNERQRLENLMHECSPLERTAIGFGYQQIFGAASNQVHLNMAATYDPEASEREFLKRVDNLVLLVISITLRAVRIAELGHGQLSDACRALRDEFSGVLPNSYEGAVIGAADVDDVVSVFSAPDFFIGIVEEKSGGSGTITAPNSELANNTAVALLNARETARTAPSAAATAAVITAETAATAAASASAQYVSYRIGPLFNIGRRGRYIDIETQVIIKAGDVQAVLNDAMGASVITQADINAGIHYALNIVIETPGAFSQIIQAYMNRANKPYLYFVERYLHRLIQSRAYHLWIERGSVLGQHSRDWQDAERQILGR